MPMIPVRTVEHVYVTEIVDGRTKQRRLNYNVVSLALANGLRYFVEPAAHAVILSRSTSADPADSIRTYTGIPHPGTNFGNS